MRKLIACLKCKEKKELGGKGLCRSCYGKLHYLNNKDKYCQRSKRRHKEKKELIKEQDRRRYLARRDEIKTRVRNYEKENVEKIKQMKKVYREKKKEYFSNYMKKYREANTDYFRAYAKTYQKERRQTFEGKLEHRIDSLRRRTDFEAQVVRKVVNDNLLKYGEICCEKCKSVVTNNYHIDHIIPVTKEGDNDYDNLQVLCRSCNYGKGVEIADYRENPKCGQLFLGGD